MRRVVPMEACAEFDFAAFEPCAEFGVYRPARLLHGNEEAFAVDAAGEALGHACEAALPFVVGDAVEQLLNYGSSMIRVLYSPFTICQHTS